MSFEGATIAVRGKTKYLRILNINWVPWVAVQLKFTVWSVFNVVLAVCGGRKLIWVHQTKLDALPINWLLKFFLHFSSHVAVKSSSIFCLQCRSPLQNADPRIRAQSIQMLSEVLLQCYSLLQEKEGKSYAVAILNPESLRQVSIFKGHCPRSTSGQDLIVGYA